MVDSGFVSALESRPPETLAERFWSLAKGMERAEQSDEPVAVVEHVLAVLDALEGGQVGDQLTANTLNFLALLRQYEMNGDLLYASPEQARGEQVDERSLVFSVGVLLFEKLTGRHPFGAEGNPQRLARMQRGEMASGVNYFPIVPAELRVVLLRAMGPFPEERWGSLAELRVQLERFVDRVKHPEEYTGPTQARPLPAIPESATDDNEPTQMFARKPDGALDLERMAQVSSRHTIARFETQPAAADDAPPARIEVQVMRMNWVGIAIGAVAGAALASLAFMLLGERDGPSSSASPPTTAGQTIPTAPPSAAKTSEVSPAEPTASPSAEPSTEPPVEDIEQLAVAATVGDDNDDASDLTGGTFDIEAGAEKAKLAARSCLDPSRAVQFGASLLYDGQSGLSRKVYFGSAQQLSAVERRCIDGALQGIDAGGIPERGTLVSYNFILSPGTDRVKGRLAQAE